MKDLEVVVMPGDGIGKHVMAGALAVLDALEARFGFRLARTTHHDGEAEYYRASTTADIVQAMFERIGATGAPT